MLKKTLLVVFCLSSILVVGAETPPVALQNTGISLPVNTLVLQNDSGDKKQVQASTEFSARLSEAFRQNLAQKMNRDLSEFQVSIENLVTVPQITSVTTGPFQILGLGSQGSQRLEGYFNIHLIIPTAQGSQEIQAMGVLKVTGPVVIAKNNLNRGHKISADDIQIVKLPWRTLSSGIPGSGESVFVGQRVKSIINAGSPLHPQLLDDPLDVQPGDLVELMIQSGPGVMIRSRGIAKQEGRVGDTIRIEQPDTKKKMSAVVRGPKAVEVSL